MQIEITLPDNSIKTVHLEFFKAMDGWNIQRDYFEFAENKNVEFRTNYTMRILSYAYITSGDSKISLATEALVENHLRNWQNIKQVFEAVLIHNGIDPINHARQDGYWINTGAEMAKAFLAEFGEMIGPVLAMATQTE